MKVNEFIRLQSQGLLNSYSQLFLSNNRIFAACILLASFIDRNIGTCGLLAVLFANISAWVLHFNRSSIQQGLYGFNSLLSGLFVGYMFEINEKLLLFLFVISFLCLILSVTLAAWQAARNLPYLSIPFLITVWTVQLAASDYSAIAPYTSGVFIYNDMMKLGGEPMLKLYTHYNNIEFPLLLDVYLKSLGAIIFQYNLLAGTLIALGMLYFSRIAFTLSLLGFFCGYGFYSFLGASLDSLYYSYIGFNFILTAIALGGFFLIANQYSYLLVMVITPLIVIIISASVKLFAIYQLPVLSLPFNIVVILTLYFLQNRAWAQKLKMVSLQLFSPEKNLYRHHSQLERFASENYFKIFLPFFGHWKISQGHNGNITHKNEYRHAWDFVIEDENFKTYRLPGTAVEDYYCYNLPVLAPAEGYVETIIDGIEDNLVGDVNLTQNWGNTIIIRHAPYLYSKLSHLKKGSIKVRIGEYVYRGQPLAHNGSSGRSPEPHLHFQLQATPYIGAQTLDYPISYYISAVNNNYHFQALGVPKEGELVSAVSINSLLKSAFHFIPGEKLLWSIKEPENTSTETWEVFTDSLNQSYLYCAENKATLWFVNNGTLFYCSSYHGPHKGMLYWFYLAAQRVLLGYYQNLEIEDKIELASLHNKLVLTLQDFVAPFYLFAKAHYTLAYKEMDNDLHPQYIHLHARIESSAFGASIRQMGFDIFLEQKSITRIVVQQKNKTIEATCTVL